MAIEGGDAKIPSRARRCDVMAAGAGLDDRMGWSGGICLWQPEGERHLIAAMTEEQKAKWNRFKEHYLHWPELGLSLDVSRMDFNSAYLEAMEPRMQKAFAEMMELERGAIANKDENRMVGHYWLRNPKLAPEVEIATAIESTIIKIQRFADAVAAGKISGSGGRFEKLLVIGIGGSALGPQFVSRALAHPNSGRPELYFIDNTDPEGIDTVLAQIGGALSRTLCLVISKSGGTKETRNGMLEVKSCYEKRQLRFGAHAVAITGEGSELDQTATEEGWLERFPMWDWVGGRTSVLSAVGLLPAAIQGIDINELIRGASVCDAATRVTETKRNPSAMMALMWFLAGNGKGQKDMVVLPYKDRLELFSKYLQQLIMESLGKELDRDGKVVNQGIAVYGNKGSTDQHAYVQQLRDGLNNFFVTFINILSARNSQGMEVEKGIATGDFLNGFYLGTREALHQNQRQSMTVTMERIGSFQIGALIALFERAVGLYASLVNINAYHQPGVEAGKRAAAGILKQQAQIVERLMALGGKAVTSLELAAQMGSEFDPEEVFMICRHLAANRQEIREISKEPIWASTYAFV